MIYAMWFLFGAIAGAVVGALVYRNNAKKIEAELAEQIASLKKKLGG